MTKKTEIILALGSNDNAEQAIEKALKLIAEHANIEAVSSIMQTKAIGIEASDFMNCIAKGTTCMDYEALKERMKAIERICGDTESMRKQHHIRMDIDILQHGNQRYKEHDWQRTYIKELIKEL